MDTTLNGRTLPARRRLDVGAYYRMAEMGILTRGNRVELIDGEIIDMTPIGSAHVGSRFRCSVADNFRGIRPKDFRVVT